MFESLRRHRGAPAPAEEPGQPAPARHTPAQPAAVRSAARYRLELAYLVGAVAVGLGWLVARSLSAPAGATFGADVAQPYLFLGILGFGGRAIARRRYRWCRACRRWNAMEWKGERVLHRRPIMQTRRTFTETFNVRGERINTSRQRTTARAVREVVDVEQVCSYCGWVRAVRETRER